MRARARLLGLTAATPRSLRLAALFRLRPVSEGCGVGIKRADVSLPRRYRKDLYELQRKFKKRYRALTGSAARYDPRGSKDGEGGAGEQEPPPSTGGKGGKAAGKADRGTPAAAEEGGGGGSEEKKKRKRNGTPGGEQPPSAAAENGASPMDLDGRRQQGQQPGGASAKKGTPAAAANGKAATPAGKSTPASLLAARLVRLLFSPRPADSPSRQTRCLCSIPPASATSPLRKRSAVSSTCSPVC